MKRNRKLTALAVVVVALEFNSFTPAQADTPVLLKQEVDLTYDLVPPSTEELAARDIDNPKKGGALVLQNLDRSTQSTYFGVLPRDG